jgi:hypothetical protein
MEKIKDFVIQDEDRLRCWADINKRSIANRVSGFNGNKERQYAGRIGELLVYRYLTGKEIEWGNGDDGGCDMELGGKKVDVKTTLRNVDIREFYNCNYSEEQILNSKNTDILVFGSINKAKGIFQILGYIDYEQFKVMADYHKVGDNEMLANGDTFEYTTNTYTIKVEYLKPIIELKTMVE